MWKVLLAEDEVFVRESVREIIDWERMGFTVVGEAGDGNEALRLIREERPDLVLADIVMPGLDGLELLKQARKEGIGSKFVMLTCMSEFEYVRQAMEYGASNYILKLSMNVKDLRETLSKIGDELAKESGKPERPQDAAQQPRVDGAEAVEREAALSPEAYPITHPEVNKIIDYIHERYSEDLSVKLLAQYVMMGENYVSALFKKKTGCTLIHYLHKIRVEKAIWYLNNTLLPVSEIGHKVGFANDNYFIKIFKRHTKKTPSSYRKANRQG